MKQSDDGIPEWVVYILECADGSLYTGITNNLARRVNEHNVDSQKGARYTRARRPVAVVFSEQHESRSLASKREYAIKQLSREQKKLLIQKMR